MIEFFERNYQLMKEHGHTDGELMTRYEYACTAEIWAKLPDNVQADGKYHNIPIVQDSDLPPNYLMLRKINVPVQEDNRAET